MKMLLKKATGGLLLAVLLLLASCSGISSVWSPGVITAEAAVKKVALSKKSTTLAVGAKSTVQLKNINTKKSISWSSSNKKVATVKKGSKGKATITAKKAGSATITAKYGGKKYTLKVAVKSPILSKKSVSLTAGKKTTIQLKNTVSSKKLTWKSSKTSVVTVKKGSSGKVTLTAKKKGTATVTATYNGKKYSCKVTVKAVSPKLSKSSVSVPVGGKVSVSLSNPVKGKKTTWKSSSTSIATVKAGTNKVTITGKKAGKVTVTATHNGKKYKCTVTVKAQSLSKTSLSLKAGGSATITLNNPVSGKSTKVSTSNAKVAKASVKSNKITIKAVGAGSATIKVAHNGKVLSCKVKVVKASTPNTTKPSTPSTEKPSTPSTEKPSTPSTEKPSTPSTEAPKPSYTYDTSGFTSRSVQEGTSGSLVITTNDPSLNFRSGNPTIVSVSKSGTGTCNFTANAVGSSTISAVGSDGLVKATATITVTAKPTPVLSVDQSSITIAGGYQTYVRVTTSVPIDRITYSASNSNIEFKYFDKNTHDIGFVGRLAGTTQIKISGGGTTVVVNVTVTSTDTDWVTYDSWIRNLLSSLGCSASNPVESFKKLGAWVVDNRDYDANNANYIKLVSMGGDCDATTQLFIDVASRIFGLEAYNSNTGYGHTKAIVIINNVKWFFDAGSAGVAGARTFTAVPSDPSIPAYSYFGGTWTEAM